MAEELNVPSIRFIAEQDGEIERQLKARIASILATELKVQAAYLVRVCYGDSGEQQVALALVCAPSDRLVQEIGAEFKAMFNERESLDFLFLDDEDRDEVEAVAQPFFKQHLHSA